MHRELGLERKDPFDSAASLTLRRCVGRGSNTASKTYLRTLHTTNSSDTSITVKGSMWELSDADCCTCSQHRSMCVSIELNRILT